MNLDTTDPLYAADRLHHAALVGRVEVTRRGRELRQDGRQLPRRRPSNVRR